MCLQLSRRFALESLHSYDQLINLTQHRDQLIYLTTWLLIAGPGANKILICVDISWHRRL